MPGKGTGSKSMVNGDETARYETELEERTFNLVPKRFKRLCATYVVEVKVSIARSFGSICDGIRFAGTT